MSRLTELIAKRALGGGTNEDGTPDGAMPPFLLNILKNFGITPESITAYADTIKAAVLQMRDDIADCKARLIVIEEELADTKAFLRRAIDSEAASLEPIPEIAPDLTPRSTFADADEVQSLVNDLSNEQLRKPN